MEGKEIKAMEKAIKEENVQLDEILKDMKSLGSNFDEKAVSNQYIQDLYRFYKLFPKHNEFDNPIIEIIKITGSKIFNIIFSTKKQKNKIAEYFYSYNHFAQANALFLESFNAKKPELKICRKIGYCYQQNADYQNAVNYYLIAEGLEKNNTWTLRRMAYCYRKLDNLPAAIDCYKTLLNNSKEDFKLIFRLAMCYLEDKNFEQALKLFYQIKYLKPDYPKIKNVLMWASLQCGKLPQAKELTEKVLADSPNTDDLVTAGHIFLALNDKKTAFLHYNAALMQIKNINEFVQIFEDGKEKLLELGIKEAHINYMLESVLINR
jgi:tetratricopeptide (TPR) repeat protein